MDNSVILTTIFVSTLILVVFAFIVIPTRLTSTHVEGHTRRLPPTVPWRFLLPRMGNMTALFNDIRRNYGNIVAIHFPFRGSLFLALGNNASQWFHSSSTKELNEAEKILLPWFPTFPEQNTIPEGHRMLLRSFTNQFYVNVTTTLKKTLSESIATWANGSAVGISFDVFDESSKMVLDVVTKAFILCEPTTWISNALYLAFPSLGQNTRKEANRVLFETAQRHAQKHLDQGLRPDQCNLDFFLREVSPSKAIHQSWGQIMASFITTSHATSWLIYHLASDPSLQRRVREEMRSVVGDGEGISLEILNKLHFMDSLVREVIRMHQHGPSSRIAQTDLKFDGFDVPRGAMILLPLAAIHFNEENLKHPFEFRPERFLNEEGKFDVSEHVRPCTLAVFGAGRHPCLGMRLAVSMLKVFAFELLTRYDLVLVSKPVIPKMAGMGFENLKTQFQLVARQEG
ncbi:cytochrome P450 [Cladochytrium replicatum]|nr:cytochrome P450 [Cladochytrium replicatum]